MSLITALTTWITTLPEPAALLLLSVVLILLTSRRRRAHAAEPKPTLTVVRRRMPSATGLTVQRGQS